MFELLTDSARQVIVLAQEEARLLGHDHLGTEHVLLGLIREGDGAASKLLESLGVQLAQARQHAMIVGGPSSGSSGPIPFSSRAQTALETMPIGQDRFGKPQVDTEQVLFGLLRGEDNGATRVLADLGVTRSAVLELLLIDDDADTSASPKLIDDADEAVSPARSARTADKGPQIAAMALAQMDVEQAAAVVAELDPGSAAKVLLAMEPQAAASILASINTEAAARLIDILNSGDEPE